MMVNSKLLIWFGLICFGIGGLVVYESLKPTITVFLRNRELLPKEETFTELFIGKHFDLPVQMEEDRIATASFTIRNMEHQDVAYPYEVAELVDGQRTVTASGESRLSHAEEETIPFEYRGTSPYAEKRIEVTLLNKNQSVYFWITNIPQP